MKETKKISLFQTVILSLFSNSNKAQKYRKNVVKILCTLQTGSCSQATGKCTAFLLYKDKYCEAVPSTLIFFLPALLALLFVNLSACLADISLPACLPAHPFFLLSVWSFVCSACLPVLSFACLSVWLSVCLPAWWI
jgi:hypothetical protein